MQTSIATFSLIYMNAFTQRAEEQKTEQSTHKTHGSQSS